MGGIASYIRIDANGSPQSSPRGTTDEDTHNTSNMMRSCPETPLEDMIPSSSATLKDSFQEPGERANSFQCLPTCVFCSQFLWPMRSPTKPTDFSITGIDYAKVTNSIYMYIFLT